MRAHALAATSAASRLPASERPRAGYPGSQRASGDNPVRAHALAATSAASRLPASERPRAGYSGSQRASGDNPVRAHALAATSAASRLPASERPRAGYPGSQRASETATTPCARRCACGDERSESLASERTAAGRVFRLAASERRQPRAAHMRLRRRAQRVACQRANGRGPGIPARSERRLTATTPCAHMRLRRRAQRVRLPASERPRAGYSGSQRASGDNPVRAHALAATSAASRLPASERPRAGYPGSQRASGDNPVRAHALAATSAASRLPASERPRAGYPGSQRASGDNPVQRTCACGDERSESLASERTAAGRVSRLAASERRTVRAMRLRRRAQRVACQRANGRGPGIPARRERVAKPCARCACGDERSESLASERTAAGRVSRLAESERIIWTG